MTYKTEKKKLRNRKERFVTVKWAASLGQAHWPNDMLMVNKFVLRVKCIHARQITQKHDVTRTINN